MRRGRTPAGEPDQAHYTPGHHDRDWMNDANCRNRDPELWFPNFQREYYGRYSNSYATKAAKQICHECPVQQACLHYALATDTRFGIWGGLDATDRANLTGRRTTG